MHSKLTKSLLVSTSTIMFGLVATNTVIHADTTNQTNPSPAVNPVSQVKTQADYQQDIDQTQQQIQQLQNQQQSVQQQVTQDQNAQQEYQNNQQQLAQAQQAYQQNYTPVDNQNVSLPQAYIDGLKHASEDQQTGQQFRQIANPEVQTHAYTPDAQAAQENIDLTHLTDNQIYRANLFANGLVNRFRQSYGTAPIQQNADAQRYTQQVADALLKTGTTGHSSLLDGAGENLGQTFAYTDTKTAKQMQAVHLDTIKPSDIVMQNHVDGNKQWNTWGFKPGVMITTMDDLYADIYYNVCQMLFNDSGLESWGHATNYLIHNTGKTYTGFAIEPIKTTGTVYIFTTTTYGDGHKKTTSKPVQVPMIDLITRWQYRSNTNKRPINPANDWNDQSKTAKNQIDKLTAKQAELKKTMAKSQDNQNLLKKINAQLSQLNNKLTQLKQAQKQALVNKSLNDSNVITLPSHKPTNSASHSQASKPSTPVSSPTSQAAKPNEPAKSNNDSQASKPNAPTNSASQSQVSKPVSSASSSATSSANEPASFANQSQATGPSTPASSATSQAVNPSQPASSANNSATKPAQPTSSANQSQAAKPNISTSYETNQATDLSRLASSATSSANKPAESNITSQAATPTQPASSTSNSTSNSAQSASSVVQSAANSSDQTVEASNDTKSAPAIIISFPEETKRAAEPQQLTTKHKNNSANKNHSIVIDQVSAKHGKTSQVTSDTLPQTGNEQHRSLAATLVGLLIGADAIALAKKMKTRRQH